jgi:TolB-like protein
VSDTLDRIRSSLAGRYVIRHELGHGGMSTVYLAHDVRHDRGVAIKVFPPALAAAIGSERFEREITITSRLTHPHILPLYDSGEAGGALYFVMPLVKGESLRTRLDRETGGLPVDEVIRIAEQIAQGLDYAHSMGVIHRDVTPDNILLSNSHALLADFGVARLVEGETLTESGMPFGTAMYRSPEQASGHARVGPASDIYGLAAVVYESAGGQAVRTFLANRFSTPVPPLRSGASGGFNAAISRAMSLDPEERFESAGDFIRALRSRFSIRLHSRAIMRTAAVLALVAIISAPFLYRRKAEAPLRTRVLVGSFVNRTGDERLASLAEMTGDYVARGLAETRLLEVIDSRTTRADTLEPASTGAATLVQGSLYKNGELIHIETRVIDTKTGRILVSTEPVEGSVSDATGLIEKVRQRLMGNFAALVGPGFEAWEAASLPPTFEAYEAILAADDAIGNNHYAEGTRLYLRAAAMDSSYVGARAMAVTAASLAHDCRTADSISANLLPRLSSLSVLDRGRIQWGTAQCHGNLELSLAAGRRVIASAPRSIAFNLLTGITAAELFRPHEAIRIFESLTPSQIQFKAAQRQFHTSFLALALHQAGEHEKELKVVREGRIAMPDEPHFIIGEIKALAALGRANEVLRVLHEAESGSAQYDRQLWNPAEFRLCAGAELLAHGNVTAGRALIASAGEWAHDHLTEQPSIPTDVNCVHHLLTPVYYYSGHEEARAFFMRVIAVDSLDLASHEALGALAAHRGDRAEMQAIDDWLINHSNPEGGRISLARARMAAITGDTARAMDLLEQAMREGLKSRMHLHYDPDLQNLRSSPRYRRLFALRD